jgi:hypothetical protein
MGSCQSLIIEVRSTEEDEKGYAKEVRKAVTLEEFKHRVWNKPFKSSKNDADGVSVVHIRIHGWFSNQKEVDNFCHILAIARHKFRVDGVSFLSKGDLLCVRQAIRDPTQFEKFQVGQFIPFLKALGIQEVKTFQVWGYSVDERLSTLMCTAIEQIRSLRRFGVAYVLDKPSLEMFLEKLVEFHSSSLTDIIVENEKDLMDDSAVLQSVFQLPKLQWIRYIGEVDFSRWKDYVLAVKYAGHLELLPQVMKHGEFQRCKADFLRYKCDLEVDNVRIATGKEMVRMMGGVHVRSITGRISMGSRFFGDLGTLITRSVSENKEPEELEVQIYVIKDDYEQETQTIRSTLKDHPHSNLVTSIRMLYGEKLTQDDNPRLAIEMLGPVQDRLKTLKLLNFPVGPILGQLCKMNWSSLRHLEIQKVKDNHVLRLCIALAKVSLNLEVLNLPRSDISENGSDQLVEFSGRLRTLRNLSFQMRSIPEDVVLRWRKALIQQRKSFSLNLSSFKSNHHLLSEATIEELCSKFKKPLEYGFLMTINKQRFYATSSTLNGPVELEWSEIDELANDQLIINEDEPLGSGLYFVYPGFLKKRSGEFQAEVAVKILSLEGSDHSQTGETKRSTERKALEHTVFAFIEHPNLVHYYGFVLSKDGSLCLVMEKLFGTLYQVIKTLNTDQKLKVLLDIAHGMDYLHSVAKYAHRDLKPRNILIEQDPSAAEEIVAKVGDFGCCRKILFEEKAELYPDGQDPPGTGSYRAPETKEIFVAASDVFSFGLIMFLVLVGSNSWKGLRTNKDVSEVTDFLNGELPDFSKLKDVEEQFGLETLESLQKCISSCLDLNWENRPKFAQLADTLERIRSCWMSQVDHQTNSQRE